MNKIKKAIDQIPLPDQLNTVVQKSLQQQQIKKKKYLLLSSVAVLFLAIFGSSLAFSNYISIPDFFKSKEEKLLQIDENEFIVQSEEFTISLKQFVEYKENILLIHELNNFPYSLTDADLVNQMIKDELLYMEAKKANISIDKEDVENYISELRLGLAELNDPIQNEIEAQLAKSLQVNLDEYYKHPVTLAKYERLLTEDEFVQTLYERGILNDQYTIEMYENDLLLKYEKGITIYLEKLK